MADSSPPAASIVTAADAHPVRRLGPTVWAVLEVLRERSTVDDRGEVFADTSVRSLAEELGLAKNTVHRALRRLRRHGLINARQNRISADMFAPGEYVHANNGAVADTRVAVVSTTSTGARRAPAPRPPEADAPTSQPTLRI